MGPLACKADTVATNIAAARPNRRCPTPCSQAAVLPPTTTLMAYPTWLPLSRRRCGSIQPFLSSRAAPLLMMCCPRAMLCTLVCSVCHELG